VEGATGAGPDSAAPAAPSEEEQAVATAVDLVDKNAPWKAGMSSQLVLTEGVVLAVLGGVVWLAPGLGARLALQLIGIALLATGLMSVMRLLNDSVEPARAGYVGFRAGVGLSIGLVTVIGALVATEGDTVTVALAVILGIGLILYALSALAAALLRRDPASNFPVVPVIIAAVTGAVGLLLILRGRGGIEDLENSFTLLGLLVLVAGLALIGYALYMRSGPRAEPAE
jgi:uncharacterized membrane protein HdeD (DUF308 family)